MKRSWIQRKRKKPDPRVFGEQAERCRAAPCAVCERHGPNDPHHVPTVAAGGLDRDTVPLCRVCHSEVHMVGVATFEGRHNVDLRAIAREMGAA